MSGTKVFDKLLEKSTSPLLLEPDWESILRLCDLLRQGDVAPKYAIGQIKKKLVSDNIHVISFSLQCLESMVKNCGSKVHHEVATKDFMDTLKELSESKPDPVKTKILELIQCWAHAFKKNPNLKLVEDYYTAMKFEGARFPRLNESEAMFDVEEAPQWIQDSDASECLRCRVEFGPLRRRHHCRACGQIFCHACSSKTAPIPKFGIEKEVRVCDACYDKLMGAAANASALGIPSSATQPSFGLAQPSQAKLDSLPNLNSSRPPEKTEQEFEEELQLALALSESEAEANKKQKLKQQQSSMKTSNLSSSQNKQQQAKNFNEAPPSAPYAEPSLNIEVRNASKKSNAKSTQIKMPVIERQPNIHFSEESSYPVSLDENGTGLSVEGESSGGTGSLDDQESDMTAEEARTNREINQFHSDLKRLLDIYVTRMRSDSARGRSITNDTAVQSLFLQLQHLHPRLLAYIKYKEDARAYYELLQDKLTQLKDAREALNALRQETYEKKRLEMEERERQRQMQIAHKLQIMRAQKQSYYMMQNQANLMRLQEQEHDLRTRLEQQRDMVLKREINTTAPFLTSTSGMQPQLMLQGSGVGAQQQMYAPQPMGMLPPQGPLDPNMQMLESSLESLRLQQAYLMQQQQQLTASGGGATMATAQYPPAAPQPQWQPQTPLQQQQQQQQQQRQQQQAHQPAYYDPNQQHQQQPQQVQQYNTYPNQMQMPPTQQQPPQVQQMAAPQQQPQVQPQVQEQPIVAELISFD